MYCMSGFITAYTPLLCKWKYVIFLAYVQNRNSRITTYVQQVRVYYITTNQQVGPLKFELDVTYVE